MQQEDPSFPPPDVSEGAQHDSLAQRTYANAASQTARGPSARAPPNPIATGPFTAPSANPPVCRHWQLWGTCSRGEQCHYLHVPSSAPSVTRRESAAAHTLPAFAPPAHALPAHGLAVAQAPLCRHYQRGYCALGPSCRFRHVNLLPPPLNPSQPCSHAPRSANPPNSNSLPSSPPTYFFDSADQ